MEEDERQEETLNRDRLIYKLIGDRFQYEWRRTEILDRKANVIIWFAEMVLALYSGLGYFLLKEIQRTYEFYIPLRILLLLGIALLMYSILCALKANFIKAWQIVPNSKYLIKEYAEKNRSEKDILRVVSLELSNAIEQNKEKNNEKVKFIRYCVMFSILGIVMIFVFVWGLLMV